MPSALARWSIAVAVLSAAPVLGEEEFEIDSTAPTIKAEERPNRASTSSDKATELVVTLAKPVSGARLLIDNQEVGEVGAGPHALTPGPHTVTIVRSGYKSFVKKISAAAGRRTKVAAELVAVSGVVTIESTPAGATLALDGLALGTLPTVVEIAPGKHVLGITKDGFQDKQLTLEVRAGEDLRLEPRLEPEAGPVVSVETDRPSKISLEPDYVDPDMPVTERVAVAGPAGPWYSRWYVLAGAGAVVAAVSVAVIATRPRDRPLPPLGPTDVCSGPCDLTVNAP